MAQDKVSYKMVLIGGSAGSLDVILRIVPLLPLATLVPFVIIIHRKNDVESLLPALLSHKTRLKVKEVEDKDPITNGCIYIAPPDYHLLIEDEKSFSLDSSEKIHYSRPSIDVSFESASQVFGPACIGILLSGANADGAEGLKKIKDAGGYTMVQNPATAEVGYMPQQAIDMCKPDVILEGAEMGNFLSHLLLS